MLSVFILPIKYEISLFYKSSHSVSNYVLHVMLTFLEMLSVIASQPSTENKICFSIKHKYVVNIEHITVLLKDIYLV